ncbi:APC family permease [Acidihalobacter ferrooxydans]|uniref:Amino acid transporter n=1 Tax=Acidihalobacter ferrooxydans TaxID=1765967 RepID=A0A1P8UII9_9GAMM|nr:APC family permease [Acidihalobacter ferrooxydans]APZ43581.1 amino acid transporter [Acidihalobacter ferrooxydans]
MPDSSATDARPAQHLGVVTLTLMTAALFLTLRNMPMMAATGLQMVFFNLITVFAFLIPIALVSAELATAWPKNGVFHWVEEAFGTRWGLTAVWLQWVQSVFGITSILSYVAASLAYAFNPALASNRYFIVGVILAVYWIATLANLRGTRASGMISSVCLSAGVLLPSVVLIGMAALYVIQGRPVHLDLAPTVSNWLPLAHPQDSLVLFLSFIFGVVGIEVSATHAREIRNVRRNYPIAVFAAAALGFVVTLLGGLAVAAVVPKGQLDLVSGSVQALKTLFDTWDLGPLVPIAALLVALGAAGQVSTWVVGPIKGLWAAGRSGNLPPLFQEVNAQGVPRNLLIVQALAMSTVALVFLVVPSVNTAFLMLTSAAVILYATMYLMLFAAAIRLRYTESDTPRPYRVPGGRVWGLWLVAGTGFVTTLACLLIGLLPPGQGVRETIYAPAMLIALALVITLPLLLYHWRRPAWAQTAAADKSIGTVELG